MKFTLIVENELAEDLARALASDATISTDLKPGGDREKSALSLGLMEAATIMTIVAGIVQLADVSVKAAQGIKKWMQKRRRDKTKIIIQGAKDDVMIEIDSAMSVEQLAQKIDLTARK